MLQDLRENYTKPGHPIFHSGINKIYEHYNRNLSKKKIEKYYQKSTHTQYCAINRKGYHPILFINITKDTNFK